LSPKNALKGGCAEAQAANEGRYCKNGHFQHENGDYMGAKCRNMLRMCAAAIVAIKEVVSNE
jgi:hypothetical protein